MEILKVLPKNWLSRTVGDLAGLEKPEAIAIKARDWFIKKYKINMDEAELPLHQYPSTRKLFIRKLKPGVRPIGNGIVHPCDANLTCVEVISGDTLIQAKGRSYSLEKMLAQTATLAFKKGINDLGGASRANSVAAENSKHVAADFMNGTHLVYYLCPTDYHRVHSPVDGEVTQVVHVPGHLWPVNEWSVNRISELFAVNERVIFHIRTALGPVALVMVGATNVGKISVSFDEDIVTNQRGTSLAPFIKTYNSPIKIEKGQELGIFHMGSTVVMLYGPNMINVLPSTGPVKLGQSV